MHRRWLNPVFVLASFVKAVHAKQTVVGFDGPGSAVTARPVFPWSQWRLARFHGHIVSRIFRECRRNVAQRSAVQCNVFKLRPDVWLLPVHPAPEVVHVCPETVEFPNDLLMPPVTNRVRLVPSVD